MFEAIVNIIHLLATAVWLGGALFMKVILEPSLKRIDPREAGRLQGVVAPRFTIAAWTSILLLIVTGILKTPGALLFDLSSDTGIILALKHLLVLGVIVIGVLIGHVAVPRLRRYAPAQGAPPPPEFLAARHLLHRLSLISTILGVVIVIAAALLW